MVAFSLQLLTTALAVVSARSSDNTLARRSSASAVLADIKTIDSNTQGVLSAVNTYQGGFLNGIPILLAERTLDNSLQSAITQAGNLGQVNDTDAEDILHAVQHFIPTIKHTLNALVNKQQQLNSDGLTAYVYSNLGDLGSQATDLGNTLVSHSPSKTKSAAQSAVSEISQAFASAAAEFFQLLSVGGL